MAVIEWDIRCDSKVFDGLRKEEAFWQIIALARAVNALHFVRSVLVSVRNKMTWKARRTRANSFLFACGILYEAILLVQKMNKNFHTDPHFAPLKALLKDKTARQIRNFHLNRARNNVVFHYLPESFGEIAKIPGDYECVFVSGRGKKAFDSYYAFADTLATEYLMGKTGDTNDFYAALGDIMNRTRQLTDDFSNAAEYLISRSLAKWGFKMRRELIPTPKASTKATS